MKKSNILLMFGVFIVGVVIGILGTILVMDGEEKKATTPHPIEEKEQVPPVEKAAVPPIVKDTKEDTDTEQNVRVTPAAPRPMGVNTSYFEGPFGIDSQKLLNNGILPSAYMIAIVSEPDFEKNNAGAWYVNNFQLSNNLDLTVIFEAPYPQQNDLKEGDFIGVTATPQSFSQDREQLLLMRVKFEIYHKVSEDTVYFIKAKTLENISSQSANCNIDNISELSVPGETRNVTGVIMAVEIGRNRNPEPDNPSDYIINKAVMKCADGNLYLADFRGFYKLYPLPRSDAFGEGDVVTVGHNYSLDELPAFAAYYKKEE